MNIVEATKSYEAWLGASLPLVAADVTHKHTLMHESALSLLRGTYYRWLQLWPKVCPALAGTPRVLGVGDLHLENFGTWRDAEGRLVWGVNDFDEAHTIAFANDLVRLAASVLVAVAEDSLAIDGKKACREILHGYQATIGADSTAPFVLEENNDALRLLALGEDRSPASFWGKLVSAKRATPPAAVRTLLTRHLPARTQGILFARRTAGTGSLGVPRFIAYGLCDGSFAAREAKARPSISQAWAAGTRAQEPNDRKMFAQAARAPDPFLHVTPHWIVRRLAPHCERIELPAIANAKARREVLHAMGRETANIHWGDRAAAKKIARDLAKRKENWLYHAASDMADATFKDWKAWRKAA
ncbi:MAG TPA: DUF2252 family protein [Rhizomicrobium sp.]|jgi:hypothetical protein|nr:DUF2252 family protein [Rhizomicrobium sp.]